MIQITEPAESQLNYMNHIALDAGNAIEPNDKTDSENSVITLMRWKIGT